MMARYLLDSSVILHILEGTSKGRKAVSLLLGQELITSIICYCEVLNKANLDAYKKAEAFRSKIPVYPLSLSDGKAATEIQLSCRRSGNQVPTVDCLIAATAKNNDASIISTGNDFERIREVGKTIL